jgi:hypothetical protein
MIMNTRTIIGAAILLLIWLLPGCAAHITQRYSLHTPNIVALKNVAKKSQVKLKVDEFRSDLNISQETCRGMAIMPPDGKTFSAFIRDALISELISNDLYDDKSNVNLRGNLKNIELHAASFDEGNWIIEMELVADGRSSFLVSIDRKFSSGFAGYTACENAKASFVPTVQDFINLVIIHPGFQEIFVPR